MSIRQLRTHLSYLRLINFSYTINPSVGETALNVDFFNIKDRLLLEYGAHNLPSKEWTRILGPEANERCNAKVTL